MYDPAVLLTRLYERLAGAFVPPCISESELSDPPAGPSMRGRSRLAVRRRGPECHNRRSDFECRLLSPVSMDSEMLSAPRRQPVSIRSPNCVPSEKGGCPHQMVASRITRRSSNRPIDSTFFEVLSSFSPTSIHHSAGWDRSPQERDCPRRPDRPQLLKAPLVGGRPGHCCRRHVMPVLRASHVMNLKLQYA